MDLELIARIGMGGATCIVILYFLFKIPNRQAQVFHTLTLVLLLMSQIISYPDERVYEWVSHIPFYISQVCFYHLLDTLIKRYVAFASMKHATPLTKSRISAFGLFPFLTDQGLQHILALPLFFLIFTMVRIRLLVIKSQNLQTIMSRYVIAGLCFAMIHVAKFLIENQKIVSFVSDAHMEIFGATCFCIGLFYMYLAASKLHRVLFK